MFSPSYCRILSKVNAKRCSSTVLEGSTIKMLGIVLSERVLWHYRILLLVFVKGLKEKDPSTVFLALPLRR